jgi:hypothetical protein
MEGIILVSRDIERISDRLRLLTLSDSRVIAGYKLRYFLYSCFYVSVKKIFETAIITPL